MLGGDVPSEQWRGDSAVERPAGAIESLSALFLLGNGTEWFLSPGLMWTLRNFAVKTGVQLPIASDLNGRQP